MKANGNGSLQERAERLMAEAKARAQAAPAKQNVSEATPTAPEEQREYKGIGPVGEGSYTVGEGDCISSIAMDMGHFWESIWNDPANSELQHARKNPNALLPGDRVALPAKKKRFDSGPTEMRHRFVRRGEPTLLILKLIDPDQEPRRNLDYTIDIDGVVREGMTDGDGVLRERISGNAKRAVLRIDGDGDGETAEVYRLKLGAIDPVREVTGMQARLNNLGYGCGAVDGKCGPRTLNALNRFRTDVGLPTSKEVDEPTMARLEQMHDQMQTAKRPEAPKPSETAIDEQLPAPDHA